MSKFLERLICSAERLSSVTPCAYPLLSDSVHCGIDDADLRKSVRVCDPDKAISMSEGPHNLILKSNIKIRRDQTFDLCRFEFRIF